MNFDSLLWVLLLGSLLGLELIGKVPPTLHTPLMSGANAISGITMLAALTAIIKAEPNSCLLYTSPSPRDRTRSRMPSSA